tara:strand:+ start:736 stop:1014 length:279 start_codon:yes stop_codon:yes gene_type:complete
MDETKEERDESSQVDEESPPEKNQLFEQMMEGGVLDNFLKGMPTQDQEEWWDFAAKTVEPYDRLIRMISEVSSTKKGQDALYNEIRKKADKQ